MGKQPEHQSLSEGMAETADLVFLAGGVYAACFTPFTRVGRGTHALYLHGPFALMGMFLYSGFARCPEMLPYMGLWAVANIIQKVLQDKRQISTYMGWPWLACRIPFVNTESKGRIVEPFLILGIGGLLLPFSQPFGMFFVVGAAAVSAREMVERAALEKRLRTMRDAAKLQEAMADMYQRS